MVKTKGEALEGKLILEQGWHVWNTDSEGTEEEGSFRQWGWNRGKWLLKSIKVSRRWRRRRYKKYCQIVKRTDKPSLAAKPWHLEVLENTKLSTQNPAEKHLYFVFITWKELSVHSFLWPHALKIRGFLTYVCSNPENYVTANKSKCSKCCKCTNPHMFVWNMPIIEELIIQCMPRCSLGMTSYTYALKQLVALNVFHFTIDLSIKKEKLHWLWAEECINISATEFIDGLRRISVFPSALSVCSIISLVF